MQKTKRKHESNNAKSYRALLLLPFSAFLILTLPSFLVEELLNYLFADKLIYPLAFLSIMTGLHFIIGTCLLIGWITIRQIMFKKFIRELLASIVLLVLALLLFIRLDVKLFETVDEINLEGKHYYLRQALIYDFSTKMWDKLSGHYIFVHKCDSLSLQCETVFLEQRVAIPGYNTGYKFFITDNQLVLAYLTPDKQEVETVWAVIEDNLDTTKR